MPWHTGCIIKHWMQAMKLLVLRYSDNGNSTAGLLLINGTFFCYTLEDEHRDKKVAGETRIPDGVYELKYRNVESPLTLKYREKFDWFKYHLHVQDVLGFTNIYIHIGNRELNTDGCLLVGNTINNNQREKGFLASSTAAYQTLYDVVGAALDAGEPVAIEYASIPKGDAQ